MRALRKLMRVAILFGAALFAAMLVLNLYIVATTNTSIYMVETVPHEQVALVLGASIKTNGELSQVLRERADLAAKLYFAKRVDKILVSGDNSSLQHNEVYPVGKYLQNKGVPVEDIFLDYAGFDTYSSMYRAKHIF